MVLLNTDPHAACKSSIHSSFSCFLIWLRVTWGQPVIRPGGGHRGVTRHTHTLHTQTREQFRVFNQAWVDVLGLLKESPREPSGTPESRIKPRTSLLWGNGAYHHPSQLFSPSNYQLEAISSVWAPDNRNQNGQTAILLLLLDLATICWIFTQLESKWFPTDLSVVTLQLLCATQPADAANTAATVIFRTIFLLLDARPGTKPRPRF